MESHPHEYIDNHSAQKATSVYIVKLIITINLSR